MQRKRVYEVFPESGELLCQFNLVLGRWFSNRETGSQWLVLEKSAHSTEIRKVPEKILTNPNHVGQIRPGVLVVHRSICAILPQEIAILLHKSLQR